MKTSEYARMAEYEQSYWWHLGRLRIIQTYMKRAVQNKSTPIILNVGCGTGGTINMLEKFGTVDNVDASNDAIVFVKQLGHERITKVDDIDLPFNDKIYDAVGAFDVLEHIEDHLRALREWKRVLKDDGAIIITVPAYQWLWSEHDVSLHHRRRYTVRSLMAVAAEAGLRPEKKSYAISFSLPLVVGFRVASRVLGQKSDSETSYVSVPRAINKFFIALLKIEAKMHSKISLPAGTSVITILRKNG
ncbi:MAG: class I SAM-dependent methyltransferase [Pseudonocardiaceae bacterium]